MQEHQRFLEELECFLIARSYKLINVSCDSTNSSILGIEIKKEDVSYSTPPQELEEYLKTSIVELPCSTVFITPPSLSDEDL